MWGYTYKHGDRPLEGFTIQRAAGRGGFGEVYYALSDGGREVALKVVTGYASVELRGIGQCMNLKSPYLVTIFDVKYNHEGRPFVIMEYVSGPSLRQMLDECPAGLGVQKTAFFLREIGKGLTYLHDCGIVHRDLKPANIFFEGGYAKIGDYGLSKAISASPDSGQTMTVGTVHYMAPEIGAGKYDRSIDIYAMGCMLYELITGTVPFVGASPSEVLMKHLSGEPDVSGVPEPFATVIKKAMAKRPEDRYQSVQEMVEAVFGAAHIRESVSVFSPADLSVAAAKAAAKVGGVGPGGGSKATPPPVPPTLGGGRGDNRSEKRADAAAATDAWGRLAGILDDAQQNASEKMRGFGLRADDDGPTNDSLPLRHRRLLAGALLVLVVIISTAAFGEGKQVHPAVLALFSGICVVGATMGIAFGGRAFLPSLRKESAFHRKLVGGLCALAAMGIPAGGIVLGIPALGPLFMALAGTFFIVDVAEWLRPDRKDRVVVAPLITAGIAAVILGSVLDSTFTMVGVVCAAGVAAAVQLLTPWDQAAGAARAMQDELKAARERAGGAVGVAGTGDRVGDGVGAGGGLGAAAVGTVTGGTAAARHAREPKSFQVDLKIKTSAEKARALQSLRNDYWHIPTPAGLKIAFLSLMGLFLALSGVSFYSMLETRSDVLPAPFVRLATSHQSQGAKGLQGRVNSVMVDGSGVRISKATSEVVVRKRGTTDGVTVNDLGLRQQVEQTTEAGRLLALAAAEKAVAESAQDKQGAATPDVMQLPPVPSVASLPADAGESELGVAGSEVASDLSGGILAERDKARRLGGMAIAFAAAALCFLRRARDEYYFGVWPSFIRPVVLGAGVAILLGVAVGNDVLREPDGLKNMLPAAIPVGCVLAVSLPVHGRRRWEDVHVPATEPSVHSRDVALALTALWFIGIAGAHRLYAGKVWTGVLWLFTFGLFGIGQLVDVILLASNQFRDGQGHPMLPKGMRLSAAATPPTPPPPPPTPPPVPESLTDRQTGGEYDQQLQDIGQHVGQFAQTVAGGVTAAAQSVDEALRARWAGPTGQSSTGQSSTGGSKPRGSGWGSSVRAHVLSGIASLLLVIGVVLTVGLAVDLPGALAARVGPLGEISLPAEIRAVENWPYLLRKLGQAGLSVMLLGAALCIMTARVGGEMAHLYRGLIGIALMGGFVMAAGYVFPAEQIWAATANTAATSQPAVLVERFVRGFSTTAATAAGAMLLASLVILSWPARREESMYADGLGAGVGRGEFGTRPGGTKVPPPTF